MDNLRHELLASQAQVSFKRTEIEGSSSHIKDLCNQLGRTQELFHDLVVLENARSDVTASLRLLCFPGHSGDWQIKRILRCRVGTQVASSATVFSPRCCDVDMGCTSLPTLLPLRKEAILKT